MVDKNIDKRLTTVKLAAAKIGCSESLFRQLLREGKLTRFKMYSYTFISLAEFDSIVIPIKQIDIKIKPIDKGLKKIKIAAIETGCSPLFFTQLIEEGRLTRFKLGKSLFISMAEFESICVQTNRPDELTPERRRLRTIPRVLWELQCSERWINQLINDGKLTTYQLHRTVFISMQEYEASRFQIRKARVEK